MDIIDKVKLSAKEKYDIARKLGATSDVARSLKSLGIEKFNMAIKPLKQNHLVKELESLYERLPKRTDERRRETYKILHELGIDKTRANQLKGSALKTLQHAISQFITEGHTPVVNEVKSHKKVIKPDDFKYYTGDKLYKKRFNYRVSYDGVRVEDDGTEIDRERHTITISKDTKMNHQQLMRILEDEYFAPYSMKYGYEIDYYSIKIKAMQQSENQMIKREEKHVPRPINNPRRR